MGVGEANLLANFEANKISFANLDGTGGADLNTTGATTSFPEFLYRAPQGFVYQWSLDGVDVTGATQSSITASAAGEYRCRVTAETTPARPRK